jgi:hypothetical protein
MGMYTYRFGSRGSVVLAGCRITFGPTYFYYTSRGEFRLSPNPCPRTYQTKYKISGISHPDYFNYDTVAKQWIPFQINDLVLTSPSSCQNYMPLEPSSGQSNTMLQSVRMTYFPNANTPGSMYGTWPPGTWIIYLVNYGSGPTVLATATGLFPPRLGWTLSAGYQGNVSVI